MRLAFLANGTLGAPALAYLATTGHLATVAWGPGDEDCRAWVAQLCTAQNLPFRAVEAGADLMPWLEATRPDLGLVFGYPWKLPPAVLNQPRFGWINLHGGPLPAFRGPQPVFWQLREGVTESALVAHRMDEGLDSGPVLASLPIPLGPDTTHGALTQMLSQAAPSLLHPLLQALETQGKAFLATAQTQGEGRTWPRPSPEDVRIAWSRQDALAVRNLVRACNPWNSGAWTSLQGQPCRLVEVSPSDFPTAGAVPGALLLGADGGLLVACLGGSALRVDILRMEEGFFTGPRLRAMGLGPGASFA